MKPAEDMTMNSKMYPEALRPRKGWRSTVLAAALLLASMAAAQAQNPPPGGGALPPNPELSPAGSCTFATMEQRADQCDARMAFSSVADWSEDQINYCNSQCINCCANYGGLTGWDRAAMRTSCDCLSAFATVGISAWNCFGPGAVNSLHAVGAIDLEQRDEILARMALFRQLRHYNNLINLRGDLSANRDIVRTLRDQMAADLYQQVGADLAERAIRIMSALAVSAAGICSELETYTDTQFMGLCQADCDRVFDPSLATNPETGVIYDPPNENPPDRPEPPDPGDNIFDDDGNTGPECLNGRRAGDTCYIDGNRGTVGADCLCTAIWSTEGWADCTPPVGSRCVIGGQQGWIDSSCQCALDFPDLGGDSPVSYDLPGYPFGGPAGGCSFLSCRYQYY